MSSHKLPSFPNSAATYTTILHHNNVLYEHDGTISAHPGNKQYLHFVGCKKRIYLAAQDIILQSVLEHWRVAELDATNCLTCLITLPTSPHHVTPLLLHII